MLKGENPTFQNLLPFFFPLPPCTFIPENNIKGKVHFAPTERLCVALVTEKTVAWAWVSLKQVRKHSLAAGGALRLGWGEMRRGWGLSEVA